MRPTLFQILFSVFFITGAYAQNTIESDHTLVVNFISIGAGIDHKIQKKFLEYIHQFQKDKNIKLTYILEPWGREGEQKYIFDLSTISSKRKKEFISSTKKMFEGNKLVQVE